MSEMRHFTVPAKGLTFEYVIHRPSTQAKHPRPLIVVQCPGWGLGSQYLQHGLSGLWSKLLYTVLFFHPRGTDGSSRPQHESQMKSMPDLASDLEDLREHLGLEQYPVLLGHSNGGAIALGYAEMYPQRVNRLILLNHQVIGIRDRSLLKLEATRNDPRYQEAWQTLLNRRTETDAEFTESVRGLWPLYFVHPERHVHELVQAIGNRTLSLWCEQAQGWCDQNLENPMQMVDGLKDVQAKTFMIFGHGDMICGMGIAERTLQSIPSAQLVAYDECGHFPWIEQRERTLEDIRKFVEGELD